MRYVAKALWVAGFWCIRQASRVDRAQAVRQIVVTHSHFSGDP